MKELIITLFLVSALISISMAVESKVCSSILQLDPVHQSAIDSIDETELIKEAIVQYYIKGLQIRDFSLIRTICIDEAKLYGVRNDGSLNITSLDQWSKRFDPDNPPFKTLEYKIQKVDCEGTAAQVKILFIINGNNKIHDYLNLLKIEGIWRIVNIIDY